MLFEVQESNGESIHPRKLLSDAEKSAMMKEVWLSGIVHSLPVVILKPKPQEGKASSEVIIKSHVQLFQSRHWEFQVWKSCSGSSFTETWSLCEICKSNFSWPSCLAGSRI
jgi:hypothetical protein